MSDTKDGDERVIEFNNSKSQVLSGCCCSCVEKMVYFANLCLCTAYSNRFIQDIISNDITMQKVADLLFEISESLHLLGSKTFLLLTSQNVHFSTTHMQFYDPLQPSWRGDPATIISDGNEFIIDKIQKLLLTLKVHNHLKERSYIKKIILETKLSKLWDELDQMLNGSVIQGNSSDLNTQKEGNKSESSAEIENTTTDKQKVEANVDTTRFEPKDLSDQAISETEKFNPRQTSSSEELVTTSELQGNRSSDLNEVSVNDKEIEKIDPELTSRSKKIERVKNNLNSDFEPKSFEIEKFDPKLTSTSQKPIKIEKLSSIYSRETSTDDLAPEVTSTRKKLVEDEQSSTSDLQANSMTEVSSDDSNNASELSRFLDSLKEKTIFMITDGSSNKEDIGRFLDIINFLRSQEVSVLVPRHYLENKLFTSNKNFERMSAWAGTEVGLLKSLDLLIQVGQTESLRHTNKIFQYQAPPVIRIGNNIDTNDSKLLLKTLMEPKSVLKRSRLEIVKNNIETESDVLKTTAINEIAFVRTSTSISSLRLEINNQLLTNVEGDGLVISTPTGSSFYSLDAGGPNVSPLLNCIIISPVASKKSSPMILDGSSTITVTINREADPLFVEVDRVYVGKLSGNEKITIRNSSNNLNELVNPFDLESGLLNFT